MKVQLLKIIITIFSLALLFFIINKFFLETADFSLDFACYKFPLHTIYSVFLLFSIAILITLSFINQRNKDIVGMTFLLMTTFKAGIILFIFSKIIFSDNKNTTERINFFIIFILFLTIETLITIRLLNKKQ